MRKLLLFAFVFLMSCFVEKSFPQCSGTVITVSNPSFEGTPTANVLPPGWSICQPGTTPDTQPGFWGVTLAPSNGSSYVGMVDRAASGWHEGAGTILSSPLY